MASHGAVIRRLEVPEVEVVNCHALSPDEQTLAICPDSEEVLIFELRGDQYEHTANLSKHSQRVTSLAWSCHGRLLSASEDRTAYVWERTEDESCWRPVLVELKAGRAATCAAWAPNGERFAVGLSSRDTAVCYYEPEVRCWVAMKVGRSKAAINAVSWHPTSQFLATGSTDCSYVVYNVTEDLMLPNPRDNFGQPEVSEAATAWINAIAFSANGSVLAFACQDSTVRFKNLTGGPEAPVEVVRWRGLPFLQVGFVGNQQLVACGFDNTPVLFQQSDGAWHAVGSLDAIQSSQTSPTASSTERRGSFTEAQSRFRGTSGAVSRPGLSRIPSLHTNTITSLCILTGSRFSTSGLDGQVIVWEIT